MAVALWISGALFALAGAWMGLPALGMADATMGGPDASIDLLLSQLIRTQMVLAAILFLTAAVLISAGCVVRKLDRFPRDGGNG